MYIYNNWIIYNMIEETKQSFIETVKLWVQTDNQIKLLNTKLKQLRTEKKKTE
jgi:hypothetical protein